MEMSSLFGTCSSGHSSALPKLAVGARAVRTPPSTSIPPRPPRQHDRRGGLDARLLRPSLC